MRSKGYARDVGSLFNILEIWHGTLVEESLRHFAVAIFAMVHMIDSRLIDKSATPRKRTSVRTKMCGDQRRGRLNAKEA
jgi:hypothetical protein